MYDELMRWPAIWSALSNAANYKSIVLLETIEYIHHTNGVCLLQHTRSSTRVRLAQSHLVFPAFTFSLPHSSSCSLPPSMLNGPFFTMSVMTSYSTSAAAMVVCSAFVSYAGATSTISAAIRLTPSRPLMMVRSSLVLQPPVSGVPVAGATTERESH